MNLPIVHVDQAAEQLGLTRDWINRTWLAGDDPAPHFRDGYQVFFEVDSFQEWARRRSFDRTNSYQPDSVLTAEAPTREGNSDAT